MMAWMPSFLMKMDTSAKGIANLRKMFNGIKSVPCVETPIQIEKRTVPAEDGYEIPIRIYKANREDTGKAVLYYIHGGGQAHIFVAGDSAGGNLAQYCTTRDREDGSGLVKGQLLLYPTLNMAGGEGRALSARHGAV